MFVPFESAHFKSYQGIHNSISIKCRLSWFESHFLTYPWRFAWCMHWRAGPLTLLLFFSKNKLCMPVKSEKGTVNHAQCAWEYRRFKKWFEKQFPRFIWEKSSTPLNEDAAPSVSIFGYFFGLFVELIHCLLIESKIYLSAWASKQRLSRS